MSSQQDRVWWRKKDLAARQGVTPRTIENWVRAGRLPPPHYFPGSPIPFWKDADLVSNDERFMRRPDLAPQQT
jgi:hypothetical protein